jgi:hypothetical protein
LLSVPVVFHHVARLASAADFELLKEKQPTEYQRLRAPMGPMDPVGSIRED